MLGEAARTAADAQRYYDSYANAIKAIGEAAKGAGPIKGPGISIKLSALHPRYEFKKHQSVMAELPERLLQLALLAKQYQLGLTIDAEEADRLDLSLDVFEKVFSDPRLEDWQGLGLAVQSYQKRALPVLQWLVNLSKQHQRRIMIRLIKGAYWDSEIKESQVQSYEGYPVFTRKLATDVSFLACAKYILANVDAIYPQFATHNAYSAAAVLEMAGQYRDFEFQCLHGMGFSLYDEIVGEDKLNIPARVYAPVGGHEDLLAYLVRRLLENGANTSFVNRIVDKTSPIEDMVSDPIAKMQQIPHKPHPKIPLPQDLYGEKRKNSAGLDFSNRHHFQNLAEEMAVWAKEQWRYGPLVGGQLSLELGHPLFEPRDNQRIVGYITESSSALVEQALEGALKAFPKWSDLEVTQRAQCLFNMADLLEKNRSQLMQLLVREAGKTLDDALTEVREAIDFCRYYALQAIDLMNKPTVMPGQPVS
jgi:RHH-type proline utilization regulon transcriptional repressor/proline dehydrogenase/delta 1-pyrroline-5-carboxylate dehydrogenase